MKAKAMCTEKPSGEPLKKIALHDWASTQFAKVPHINTLRKWARTKQIKPAPELVGREYLVLPTARYVGKKK